MRDVVSILLLTLIALFLGLLVAKLTEPFWMPLFQC